MRLPKQSPQIIHLTNKFYDNEPYPVGMTVNGLGGYTRDAAGGFEFRFCSDPSLVQSHDVAHELPDAMRVVILDRILVGYNREFPVQNSISDER